MQIDMITRQDLQEFRKALVAEISEILKEKVAPPRQWLRSTEVKKMLNISAGKLQSLRINGTFKGTKIGGTFYYKYEDIQKALETNTKGW